MSEPQKARVLVVDDDEVISEAIVFNLNKRGYRCYRAFNGLEGLRQARRKNPDIMLLDLMLPGMDGWKLCEQIRNEGFRFPIIILSVRTAEPEKVRGLGLGADDYMTKPFGMDELLARVEANLRRGRLNAAIPDRKIVAEPLVIEPQRREVLARGRSLKLTPKEFAVLYCIARRSPRTVSREEVYRTVWGYEMMPGDRSVDVFIRRIRKKLESKLPRHNFLQTSHGFGYKFINPGDEPAGER